MPRPQRPWFRLYVETMADSKLRRMPVAHRWVWIGVLAAARQSPTPGVLLISPGEAMTVDDLADFCAVPVKNVSAALAVFERYGMVDTDPCSAWRVVNWSARQFESDAVTERTRKYRSNTTDRNDVGTFQRRSRERSDPVAGNGSSSFPGTAPETDTETETYPPPYPPPYPKVAAAPLTVMKGEPDQETHSQPTTPPLTVTVDAVTNPNTQPANPTPPHNPTSPAQITPRSPQTANTHNHPICQLDGLERHTAAQLDQIIAQVRHQRGTLTRTEAIAARKLARDHLEAGTPTDTLTQALATTRAFTPAALTYTLTEPTQQPRHPTAAERTETVLLNAIRGIT